MMFRRVFARTAAAMAMLLLAACGQPPAPNKGAGLPAGTSPQAAVAEPAAAGPEAAPGQVGPIDLKNVAPKPALWRTGDADTTIYFLGTVHVLPPSLNWRTPAIDKAVSDAKAVYFETDLDPPQAEMEAFITRLGVYPAGQSLSDGLDAAQKRALADAAAKLSVSMIQLDTMRPWLAMIALNQPMTLKAGYQPESGVERTLAPLIAAQHKQVRKLETVEEQLMAFADLPDKVQVDYLLQSLKDLDRNTELLNRLVKAWVTGDVDQLEKLLIEDDVGEDPAVEQALLINRNRNWSVKLDKLVKTEPGTFLVAVGAAHLAGKDSVRAMLEAKGYKVERVE
jgi:uncharacterized protein YbaP (TraB family)